MEKLFGQFANNGRPKQLHIYSSFDVAEPEHLKEVKRTDVENLQR